MTMAVLTVSCLLFAACDIADGFNTEKTLEIQIKEAYLKRQDNNPYAKTIDDITIIKNYGTYNECTAVMMTANGIGYTQAIEQVYIGQVYFCYNDGNSIIAYKDGEFSSLQDAFDRNWLSKDDLSTIAAEHNGFVPEEKIYWNGDINENFDDETIIVVIDKNFTDSEFSIYDFRIHNIVSAAYLTSNPNGDNFRHIMALKIANKGKQNVIDTIRAIEYLVFVKYVGPNYYGEAGG